MISLKNRLKKLYETDPQWCMCYVGLCMCIGLRVVNIISGIPHPPPPPPPPPPPRTHKKPLPASLLEVVHETEAGGAF